jgi:hypothetical protein
VWLAKRQRQREIRHRRLRLAIREEKERELMEVEDQLAQAIRTYINASKVVNRLFRAFMARHVVLRLKIQMVRAHGKAINLTAKERAIKHAHEVRVARITEEFYRNKAARLIQRVYRGFHIRMISKELRYKRKKELCTIRMQALYRKILAVRKAAALRRYRANLALIRDVRKRQGVLLRILGFRERFSQRRFLDFLDRIGLEPRHYELDMAQQWREMKEDYQLAKDEMRLELEVFKRARFDRYAAAKFRAELAKDYLPVVVLENRDPVRIVMRGG